MNEKNIKLTSTIDTDAQPRTNERVRKRYKSPVFTNIGRVNQVTLAGGLNPVADSGSTFSS